MLRGLLIVGISLFIAGCDFYEPVGIIESDDRPIAILGIRTYTHEQVFPPHLSRYTVCFEMNMPELWRIGDNAHELNQYLAEHSVLTVDNNPRPFDISSNSLATINFKYDENNKLLGTYGDGTFCYGVDDLETGVHSAVFETEATDGGRFSYNFDLRVRY